MVSDYDKEHKPHSMFEDCLAVREVLQAYAPVVNGLPIHEGEAAMGRIEEQLETQQEVVRRYVVEISRAPGNRDQAAVDAASEALVALVSNPASERSDLQNIADKIAGNAAWAEHNQDKER